MHNGFRTYLSHKTPLINNSGKLVGLLGISIDVTDRKNADELRVQNRLKKIEIERQQKNKLIAERTSHDIRSPLIALESFAKSCKNLSEKEHIALRNIITSVTSIANNLLCKYNEGEQKVDERDYVAFPLGVLDALENIKRRYADFSGIKFDFSCETTSKFSWIRGGYSDFCRMLSNLVNNAVEALVNKSGVVAVKLVEEELRLGVRVKDSGRGMPREIAEKIMSDIPVKSSKEGGYGIGMRQIRDALQKMNGLMTIESTEGAGTEITLEFPKSPAPSWFAEKIAFRKGDTVVALDDDPSIHSVWANRLDDYSDDISVKYFTDGAKTIDFINSVDDKNKIFLLADYELRGQDLTGVDVIEKCEIQRRSVVVSSVYIYKIEDFLEKFKVAKFMPKPAIDDIPIEVV
jgi:hypothetical protein